MLSKATEDATTMPEDHHYQLRSLCTLFTKPGVAVRSGRVNSHAEATAAGDGTEGWYDYGNENDAENFCPVMDGGDDDDDDDDAGMSHGFGEDTLLEESMSMIGAPAMAGKVTINYARAAKKVDVQLLKERIWTSIDSREAAKPLAQTSASRNNTKPDAEDQSNVFDFNSVRHGHAGVV